MTSTGKSTQAITVSIVTVVRNDRAGFRETAESIRAQTHPSIEFIVIDGKSTDDTLDAIKANSDIVDYWVSEEDQGIYDAMNKGLSRATGEFILFLNAGDKFLGPGSLRAAVNAALGSPETDLFYFKAVGEDGRSASSFEQPSAIQFDSVGNHQAALIRTAVHKRFRFDTRYKIKADREVQLRMFLAGCRMRVLSRAITFFRPGGVSSTAIFAKERENVLICCRNRVKLRWCGVSICLAISRISLHGLSRMCGLDWDKTKSCLRSFGKSIVGYHDARKGKSHEIRDHSRVVRVPSRVGAGN